jgi:hypothetical protein
MLSHRILYRVLPPLVICLATVLTLSAVTASARATPEQMRTYPADRVLTHREQADIQRGWIEKRFDTLLTGLMRREGIDMWIVVSREYNDDPVFRSMAPPTTFSYAQPVIRHGGSRGTFSPDRGPPLYHVDLRPHALARAPVSRGGGRLAWRGAAPPRRQRHRERQLVGR